MLGDVATQVEHLLAAEFKRRGLDPKSAPMYAQMLVGMVALTGQWWLDRSKPKKEEVAAHLVNLAWNGLAGLDPSPDFSACDDADPPAPSRYFAPRRYAPPVCRLAGSLTPPRPPSGGGTIPTLWQRSRCLRHTVT